MQKENIKISSFSFISFSLLAFVSVSFLYFFLGSKMNYAGTENASGKYEVEEVYYNENYNYDDPYLTKAPGMKNTLRGPIISNADPYLGSLEAPVKIIVFSDFTCQYCKSQEKIIKNILQKYDGSVRFIWKDYPDTDVDSTSLKAALAARCAQEQGSFWEYHDEIFSLGPDFAQKDIYSIADKLGLDQGDFEKCYQGKETISLVSNNIKEADALGIIGVPNTFINDKEFIGSVSEEDFSLVIESFLKQNE